MLLYETPKDKILPKAITDKCIVLDLDHTLISTQDDDDLSVSKKMDIMNNKELIPLRLRSYTLKIEEYDKDSETPGDGYRYDMWGITRPHIEDFLIFCFSYFRLVIVWSAGIPEYVEKIVDRIFGRIRPPHIVFTRDDCVVYEDGTIIKPLKQIIELNPLTKKEVSLSNTLALDDTSSTFSFNEKNGVLIPAYKPVSDVKAFLRDDPALLQFKAWLLTSEVKNSVDVRNLDKSKIFTTDLKKYKEALSKNQY